MLRGRSLWVGILIAWFAGATWPWPARGQVQRLPVNTVRDDLPAAYHAGPHRAPVYFGGPPVAELAALPDRLGFVPLPPSRSLWTWQLLPNGLIYPAYLAGSRESRLASHWVYEREQGWLWDVTLGGRVGVLRYGNQDPAWPEGWQLDVEGAAFPRMSLKEDRDVVSTDFRFGVPLTFRFGRWESKLAYYHLSSHLGDELLEDFPSTERINYVRDVIVLGLAVWPHRNLRLYAEAGWGMVLDGGAEPWEFQFGFEYSPAGPTGILGAPFFAVHGRVREEVDFGGNFTAQLGRQWRGPTGHLFRFGALYFRGKTDQYQFFNQNEEQIGLGLWYDF